MIIEMFVGLFMIVCILVAPFWIIAEAIKVVRTYRKRKEAIKIARAYRSSQDGSDQ